MPERTSPDPTSTTGFIAGSAAAHATTSAAEREPMREAIREVFLSPRVVDREAFNDYSSLLRRLIEDASGHAQALRTAAGDAALAREALREFTGKSQPRLDAAARALELFEKRAAEVESLIDGARASARGIEAQARDAQDRMARSMAEFEARLVEHQRRLEDHAAAAEAGLRQRLEALSAQVEQAARTAQGECVRSAQQAVEMVREGVNDADARARDIEQRLERSLAQSGAAGEATIARGREQADALAAALNERFDAAHARGEQQTESQRRVMEEQAAAIVASARGKIDALGRALHEQINTTLTAANGALARLNSGVSAARTLLGELNEAERTLAPAGEVAAAGAPAGGSATSAAGSAGSASRRFTFATVLELIERADQMGEHAAFALRQLDSVRQQADQARSMLGEAIISGSTQVDSLRSMSDELHEKVRSALARADQAGSTLSTREHQIRTLLEGPVAEMQTVAASIREQLTSVAGQVERSRTAADDARAATNAIVERLSGLVAELEPWRAVLLEDRTPDQLPAPLAKLIAQVRGELSADLKRIARAMEFITGKASGLAEGLGG
ncbi:MAG: hypothetical protein ACK48N_10720 [Planctomyces sp.]|jgi:hypothetical protein|nr:hypothetical protein [Phycisphaeraceae bacterium]